MWEAFPFDIGKIGEQLGDHGHEERLLMRAPGKPKDPSAMDTLSTVQLRIVRVIEERSQATQIPRLWSTRALAARLSVHRLTIYRAHRKGRLPGVRVLGCLRFTEEAVVRLLREEGVEIEEGV